MPNAQIVLYGAHWCPDCRRSKQFLGEHQIPYTWVDIEQDPTAEALVISTNGGKRIVPTIVFPDGSFLAEPSNAELAEKLGLKTAARLSHYDLIVIGGGPAGLTAAIYAAREAIDTLVIERAAFGGQAAGTEKLDNMPGFPDGVDGMEFSQRLRQQAERFGTELLQAQSVVGIERHNNYHRVRMGDDHLISARAVLIATGSRYKLLGVPGESQYSGAGVHFCATCDGPFYKGKDVAVVGGGNSAAEESLLLTKFADKVTILVRGDSFKATRFIQEKVFAHPRIDVRWHSEVTAFRGAQSKLGQIDLVNNQTSETSVLSVEGAFIFIGLKPNSAFLNGSNIQLDPWGFLVTGPDLVRNVERPAGFENRDPYLLETSVPGIFAAGDIRHASTKQVVSAAGEGSTAALEIRDYLRHV